MSLIYNGSNISSNYDIKYNNTNLSKLIYNGITVWTKQMNLISDPSLIGSWKWVAATGGGTSETDADWKNGGAVISSSSIRLYLFYGHKYSKTLVHSTKPIDMRNYTKLRMKYQSVGNRVTEWPLHVVFSPDPSGYSWYTGQQSYWAYSPKEDYIDSIKDVTVTIPTNLRGSAMYIEFYSQMSTPDGNDKQIYNNFYIYELELIK